MLRNGRLLAALTAALTDSAQRAGAAAVVSGRWLSDVIADLAPRIPIRDAATLRAHHPGRSDEEIAAGLITVASRLSGAIGAAGGALASVEFTAPPALLAAPVQMAAEVVALVAIEIKLVAELHELAGRAPAGPPTARAGAYLAAWANRRGLTSGSADERVSVMLTAAGRRQLRQRIVRRAARNMTTFAPVVGAFAGAEFNRRETAKLGERIARDLRAASRRRGGGTR